ncbi:NhaP-type Na+/H+ or K+/H+ antiporter [Acholeplasma morum]|uniref:cation:proton antiporter n=1 Tax=Paracholeplasma morum TaxID=264637 RepID=UPI001956CEEB|nr:cation:proton antiporter [Paracholeplasma morum]MBM7453329.1 NhaP-type Na+/H+ or K+/H+ antiporter [Paracholeplasma morum]
MLLSLSYMILLGLVLAFILKQIKIPALIGFLLTGIILGPFVLNQIDSSILSISSELRTIALVVILLRAGFMLKIDELKENGIGALLLTFLPATFEVIGTVIFTNLFLDWTLIDGFMLGAILAAVSPAVVVPRMIKLIEQGMGYQRKVPQMVMAGASADDIFVILLFSLSVSLKESNTIDWMTIINFPISILLGIGLGLFIGYILVKLFKKVHMRDTVKVLIILSMSFMFISFEKSWIEYSGLLAVLCLALMILKEYELLANRLLKKYEKIWVFAEMLLFILVGALLNLTLLKTIGLIAFLLILFILTIRTIGVLVSVSMTQLNKSEKTFVALSYMPKATVQASIGSIPLLFGFAKGEEILTFAIASILITAPIGAYLIDLFSHKLLKKDI